MPRTKSIERDKNKDEHVPTSEVVKELSNMEKHRIGNKRSAQAFRSRQKGADIQILYGLIANADLANLDQLKHEKERLAREVKILNDERKQLRNEKNKLICLIHALLSSPDFSTFMREARHSDLQDFTQQGWQQSSIRSSQIQPPYDTVNPCEVVYRPPTQHLLQSRLETTLKEAFWKFLPYTL